MLGKSRAFLLIKQFVQMPNGRIFINVYQINLIVFTISYDVIVKIALPNIMAVFFITKPFKS